MFIVPVKSEGVWRSPAELVGIFRALQSKEKSLEWEDVGKRVAILTSDNRKTWAENREILAKGKQSIFY